LKEANRVDSKMVAQAQAMGLDLEYLSMVNQVRFFAPELRSGRLDKISNTRRVRMREDWGLLEMIYQSHNGIKTVQVTEKCKAILKMIDEEESKHE
jgi:hypothetical protein